MFAEGDGEGAGSPLAKKVGCQGGCEAILNLNNLCEKVGHIRLGPKQSNYFSSWTQAALGSWGGPGAAIDSLQLFLYTESRNYIYGIRIRKYIIKRRTQSVVSVDAKKKHVLCCGIALVVGLFILSLVDYQRPQND